jgi:hypothetical protein
MSTEVYLLSIPLARHRTIVPRPRRNNELSSGSAVREPEHPRHGVADTLDAPRHAGAMQRIDPG